MTLNWRSLSDILLMVSTAIRHKKHNSANPSVFYSSRNFDYEPPLHVERILITSANKLLALRRGYHDNRNSFGLDWRGFPLSDALVASGNARCSKRIGSIYGLLGLADTGSLNLFPNYEIDLFQLYKNLMAQTGLWISYQLVRFSSFIQVQLGGFAWETCLHQPQLSSNHLYQTVARSHGVINILGDSFSTPTKARTLFKHWRDLSYHKINSNDPSDEGAVVAKDAFMRIKEDSKTVISIDRYLTCMYAPGRCQA